MEKILRIFATAAAAEQAAREDDNALTYRQRFAAFMQLMEPYYAASAGFQRIYRVDDFRCMTLASEQRYRRTTNRCWSRARSLCWVVLRFVSTS